MNLIRKYYDSFIKNAPRRAFKVNNADYSYQQFFELVNGSRELIEASISGFGNRVGVVCSGDIETYAAIFAIWFSGNCFVPINPGHPLERNRQVLQKTGVKYVLSAKPAVDGIIASKEITLLVNSGKTSATAHLPIETPETRQMYILTTSGSTGEPKQVPINLKNLEAFCNGFLNEYPELSSEDSFLQTYDLTSDAAFTGYLIPLLIGACVYTLPEGPFKFLSIAGLMSDKMITWIQVTPSVLNYLKPYLQSLDLKHIRHFHFGGEALPLSEIRDWWPAFPDAEISNVYGPTETTITATVYKCNNFESIKSFDGIISIGKPLGDTLCKVVDEDLAIVEPGGTGELCIGGKQTMDGYLNSDTNHFVDLGTGEEHQKYYRTGDKVRIGEDGYFYYLGRLDDQVKINGYRLNLAEVENAVRNAVPGYNILAVTAEKAKGIKALYIFIENFEGDSSKILSHLRCLLPPFMVPEAILPVPNFPVGTSGKTDRKRLINENIKRLT